MAKSIVWRDPNMLQKYLPMELVEKKQETELYVEFKNGSLLVVRGSDEIDSIRGIDCQGVFLDEWSLIRKEAWEEALRPIIIQRKDRWAIFAFTPKGMNHAYDYWEKSKDWQDWWRLELRASQSGLLPQKELDQARSELPAKTYEQEMECSFISGAVGVFRNVMQCVAGDFQLPDERNQYVIGVDFAKTVDYNTLFVLNRNSKHLDYFARWNKCSWALTRERVRMTAKRYNDALVVPDLTGVGDPLGEELMRAGVSIYHTRKSDDKSIPGVHFTNTLKQQMVEKLMISIEQRMITFPHIDVLIDELFAFQPFLSPTGKVTYRAPDGKHDDCVTALMLAVWGLHSDVYEPYKPHLEQSQANLFWKRVAEDKKREVQRRVGDEAFREVIV